MCKSNPQLSTTLDFTFFISGGTLPAGKHILSGIASACSFVIENKEDILIEKIIVNYRQSEYIMIDFNLMITFMDFSGLTPVQDKSIEIVFNPSGSHTPSNQTVLNFNKYYQEATINKIASGLAVQLESFSFENLLPTQRYFNCGVTVFYSKLPKPC